MARYSSLVHLHRLAEERSLAFHRAVAERLRTEPELTERALRRLEQWRAQGSVHADYVNAWMEILSRPTEEIIASIVDPGERARDLRQATPFAGAIDPRTRWRIWRETRRRLEAERP